MASTLPGTRSPETLGPIAERAAPPATLTVPSAGGLTWRPAEPADAPAWLALRNRIMRADQEPYQESLEEIQEIFDAPWRDMTADSLLGVDGDGELRAWASVESPPGDVTEVRAFCFGGVHPDRRGEGIGRELLAWSVGRARQLLAATAKDVPARIAVFVQDDAPATTHRMLEHAGFEVRRYYSDLRRWLVGPDAAPLAEVTLDGPLRLVPWSEELDEATRLAHNDAFRDHWNSQPRTREQWAAERSTAMPAWSYLVVDDDPDVEALLASPDTDRETAAALRAGMPLVVGYQMAAKYAEDFAVRGYSFGYVEILGSRRAYRGRRTALAALTAGMRAFARDGMEAAVLDVDTANPSGATGLYASLGFVKEHGSRLVTIEL